MNSTHIHHHLWPYALRGSITLIVENTTVENFEHTIYRNLRQSIAKIIRKFCSTTHQACLSNDANVVRADHVIIQSYEEQLDDRRLYVAVFIKDPYRQDIALTNDQFLIALKRHQQQLYQDVKHRINIPSTYFEQTLLDPIWLYGVCLLALLVLVVVILMLITILNKRTVKMNVIDERNCETNQPEQRTKVDGERLLISPPMRLANEDDQVNSTSFYNESETSEESNSTVLPNLPPSSYFSYSVPRTSYFNSAIETAIKQHLQDDEPIPFIDDNLSITHSRKSSACWSDRTSLSSRFGFAWKLNLMRSGSQTRPPTSSNETRANSKRFNLRTIRYTMSPSEKLQFHDEL
ncbi:unnamed protein product [Rotaria magnacalcarata]|uniref:Uncharacterized protein n=8 Tax=Rotaria magnacalcarata TaxID=392030 RepID=A0A816LUE6_9BILA|nr:unnamed protein product [Rotaria magnacalcarata]CAF1462386.1 unnamed protein product [Rotaria magnacalcarata]CAF1943199.1 unnamed protein product [Rotaria magnacalcarata]